MTRMEGPLRSAMFDQYTTAALRSIYGQAREHDLQSALGTVRVPTLVIGGAEDMLFPPAVTEALAAAIPGSSLEFLPPPTYPGGGAAAVQQDRHRVLRSRPVTATAQELGPTASWT
ncbi:alpha/beta fold hydrolase [Streptomyces nogalater]